MSDLRAARFPLPLHAVEQPQGEKLSNHLSPETVSDQIYKGFSYKSLDDAAQQHRDGVYDDLMQTVTRDLSG